MINFFRKTRKKMADDNRPLKYMRYAIGEILLVVIGILIALSINNWNQSRIKQTLMASYEISLMNDLSLDTLMLGRFIDENYKALKSLRMQQDIFLGPETPMDTLIKIARNEFDPNFNVRFKYNRNTINTLIASGNIDLFNMELNEMLMTLISLQDMERENSKYYAEVYTSKLSRYTDDYPVSGHINSNIVNSIWVNLDEKKLSSRFISLTDIKGFGHYSFLKEIEKIKEQTTIILEQLNSQN
jgi:hypothetical protein